MGCDIHLSVEKKIDNKWLGVASSQFGYNPAACIRDYKFFAELASVRGESSIGRIPNGIPEDISDLTKIYIEECDGHSFGWATAIDFCNIWSSVQSDKDPQRDAYYFYDALGFIDDDEDNFRIIFWFDN